MAGYIKTALRFKPTCFLTFDGESFYDTSGYLNYPHFDDVSNNNNFGFMVTTGAPFKPYKADASLVPRQAGYDMKAITFSPDGYTPTRPFPYESARIEVFHTTTLGMEDEFTISFLFNKRDNDSFFASQRYNGAGDYTQPSGWNKTFLRTIFQKGNKVGMFWRHVAGNQNQLIFQFPDKSYSFNIEGSSAQSNDQANRAFANFYNRTFHIVIQRKKIPVGTTLWKTVNIIYVDGVKFLYEESNVTSNPSTALTTSSIFIGGNAGVFDPELCEDRQTSPITIDNFLVYNNQCLTEDQVAQIYKKAFPFVNMIQRWYPLVYAQLDDEPNPNINMNTGTLTVRPSTAIALQHFGTSVNLIPKSDGSLRLMGLTAMGYRNGGMSRIVNTASSLSTVVNPSQDWTVQFFASFGSSKRGILFAMQNDYYPFKGLVIEANAFNDEETEGAIQVKLENGVFLNTIALEPNGQPIKYNDDKMRMYTVCRRGNQFEFWLDGTLVASGFANGGSMLYDTTYNASSSDNTIYLMSKNPNNNFVVGKMQQLSIYNIAMQPHLIRGISFFFTRMRLNGVVTLQQSPHSATLRFSDHTTGAFVVEGQSSGNDGEYDIDVYSDSYLDLMVFDKTDPNVRYRAFGPIIADEYTDIDTDILE